ncbi:MAG: methyl-accepting chemotaxis protein [Telluria sp.]
MSDATRDIASGNMDLSARTERQASSVEEVASSMEQLAKRIEDIIGLIDGIAFQTNLLALNASGETDRVVPPRRLGRSRD